MAGSSGSRSSLLHNFHQGREGINTLKTQLLTDTFEYTKPDRRKRKSPSRAKSTKPRASNKPKVRKEQSAKAPKPLLTEEQKR